MRPSGCCRGLATGVEGPAGWRSRFQCRPAKFAQLRTAPSAHAIRLAKPHWAVHLPGMKTLSRKTDDLIGTYRTFGEAGPVYEVLRKVDGATVHIVVVETGEELNYPAAEALNDPEAE